MEECCLNKPSLRELVLYFLKLGATGFGGPIALIGYMERDLVEKRGWFSTKEYKQGLALSQLAPGPVAAQLAIYLGHVHSGALGATAIGLAFTLPSFVIVVSLAAAYVHCGGLPWVHAVFYGVGAAVMAIMLRSAYHLTRSTMDKRRFLWAVYALLAVVTAVWQSEIGWLFVFSGVAALFLYAPPRALALRSLAPLPLLGLMAPQGLPPVSASVLGQIFLFFAKAGTLIFGSGLVIVPFLYGGVVREFHWLNDRQFLDAVAVAMITPGPVAITVAFIGYLVAGLAGSSAAALGMFLPVYLFVVVPAAWFRKHGSNPQIEAFVDGVTAA
ncbi:MAG: chromate transporter, partial [Elusimicrobia bacterium RIFCSPHIGHO2_02_FULL_57_9]